MSKYSTETQKNIAQKFFPNKCKATLQRIYFEARLKTQVPENYP